jgi:TPR repeat protein
LNDGDAAVELAKLYLAGKGVRRNARAATVYLLRAVATPSITEAGREAAQSLIGGSAHRPDNSLKQTRGR